MSALCYCTFCGKSQHEVDVMLSGPGLVFICNTCVNDASEQIARKMRDDLMVHEAVRCDGCTPAIIDFSSGGALVRGMQMSATGGARTRRPAHPKDTISGGPIGPSELQHEVSAT